MLSHRLSYIEDGGKKNEEKATRESRQFYNVKSHD